MEKRKLPEADRQLLIWAAGVLSIMQGGLEQR